MRCPKCGYFSFDHLKTCKKCGKDISKISEEIDGTIYDVLPPVYLHLDLDGPDREDNLERMEESPVEEPQEEADAASIEVEEVPSVESEESDLPFELEDLPVAEGEDFHDAESLGEKTVASAEQDLDEEIVAEEETLEIAELTMESEAEEISASTDRQAEVTDEEEDELTLPKIDFDNLDISDLGPEADEEALTAEALSLEQDLGLAEMEAAAPTGKAQESPIDPGLNRLEDLQLEGLDLETTAMAASRKKKGGDDLKTGTALDDFDVDISEFLTGKKG